MNKFFALVICIMSLGFSAHAGGPFFNFSEKNNTFDFGKVKEGKDATHTFTFRNTGDAPIIIGDVNADCGCTTPTFSRTPVAPGKSGTIVVKYDTKGRVGPFVKSIYILSNATNVDKGERMEIKIKGEVTK